MKNLDNKVVMIGATPMTSSCMTTAAQLLKDKGLIVRSDIIDPSSEEFNIIQKDFESFNTPRNPWALGDVLPDNFFKITNEYTNNEDYSFYDGIKHGSMGGINKEQLKGFTNRISKRRKKNKNKKTHRK